MDKRAQVLCMGLLVKSPTKHTEKAMFAAWWKVRWCVFTKITFDGAPQKTKLILSYYKDQESHSRDEKPEGQVNITESISIRSNYMSKAGFHHIFIVKQNNGKDTYFSAPTCQLKSKWIVMLYSYKFNSTITGTGQQRTSSIDSRRSKTSGASDSLSLGTSRKDSIDSGTFSRTLTINSQSSAGSNDNPERQSQTPPPLPEPRKGRTKSQSTADEPQLLEDLNWIFTKLQTSPTSPRGSKNDQSDVSSSDDKIRMQSIVDALFPWCKSCDEVVHKKKSIKKTMSFKGVFSSKKRKSLKKNASCDIEVPIQASSPRQPRLIRNEPSPNRQSFTSCSSDGSASQDSVFEEDDCGYQNIAEDWIQQVRQKLEDEKQKACKIVDADDNDNSGAGNDDDNEDNGDDDDDDDDHDDEHDHDHDDHDHDDDDHDDIYVDMNVIKEEVQAANTFGSLTAVNEPLQTDDQTQTENEDLKRENHALRKMLELLRASNPQMLPAEVVEKETIIDGNLVFEMTL